MQLDKYWNGFRQCTHPLVPSGDGGEAILPGTLERTQALNSNSLNNLFLSQEFVMEMLSVGSFLFLVFLTGSKCLIAGKVHSRAMRTDGEVYMK